MSPELTNDLVSFIWQVLREPIFATVSMASAMVISIAIASLLNPLFNKSSED